MAFCFVVTLVSISLVALMSMALKDKSQEQAFFQDLLSYRTRDFSDTTKKTISEKFEEYFIDESKGGVNDTLRCLQETGAELIDMDISRKKVGMVKLDLRLKLEPGVEAVSVVEHLEKQPFILEVES